MTRSPPLGVLDGDSLDVRPSSDMEGVIGLAHNLRRARRDVREAAGAERLARPSRQPERTLRGRRSESRGMSDRSESS